MPVLSTTNGHLVAPGRKPRTSEQVLVTSGVDGQLSKTEPFGWARKVRKMRRDPTLSFVRALLAAPIMASDWTVVASDPKYEDAVDLVYASSVPHRLSFVRNSLRGLLDFGWQPFERVNGFDAQGYVKVEQLKPLLQDITTILVNERGDLVGVRNLPTYLAAWNLQDLGPWTDLSKAECVVVSRDVEGTNWYGEPLMRSVETAYDSWEECEVAAKRFDTKIAGAHWVVYYPVGHTLYNGRETDNAIIAADILNAMEASGKIAIPLKLLQQVEDLNDLDDSKLAWRVELLTASGSSEGSFVGRQKYLDALKARGLGIPERAVFEGQFGTKAEAEAHADFAIDNIEMMNVELVSQFNDQVSDPLLLLNRGEQYVGQVEVQAMPISDWRRAQLRQLYMTYFATEGGQAEELDRLDIDAIREQLHIPTRDEEPRVSNNRTGPEPDQETRSPEEEQT